MDIRPVDIQMFINKSSDNNKNNNDTLKQNEIYQNLAYELEKNNERDSQKTVNINKSEGENIKQNEKGDQNFSRKKRNKKEQKGRIKEKESEPEKEESKAKKTNSIFDVSI